MFLTREPHELCVTFPITMVEKTEAGDKSVACHVNESTQIIDRSTVGSTSKKGRHWRKDIGEAMDAGRMATGDNGTAAHGEAILR